MPLKSLFITIQAIVILAAQAATYYVATDGNDSWTGLAPAFVSGTTGPWLTFSNVNNSIVAGDTVYVRGGVYDHTSDSTKTSIRLSGASGTLASPIVITNYPGEIPIIYGSGENNNAIYLYGLQYVNLYGITVSNAYRAPILQYATNCIIAYNTFIGEDTNYEHLAQFTMYNNSRSNYVHHNTVVSTGANPNADGVHTFTVGQFYETNDFTACNLIESNIVYWSGHDAMSIYGPSNIVRGNWIHNEPWYYRADYEQICGHRCLEVGGTIGNFNVIENNRLAHAGVTGNGGSHGLELSSGCSEIIRFNDMILCDYSGLTIYGKGPPCESNYVYGNTIAWNGFGQRYVTNYSTTNIIDNNNWKEAITLANTTNNVFVNNLLWGGYSDRLYSISGVGSVWLNNMTNVNPSFKNTNDGGAFSQNSPNCELNVASAAIDAGGYLTTITSASGSGTTFTVSDAMFFFAGLTTDTFSIPGDQIQLSGRRSSVHIIGISGNTLTVDATVAWVNGQGVNLAFNGSAPDVGAHEYNPARINAVTLRAANLIMP